MLREYDCQVWSNPARTTSAGRSRANIGVIRCNAGLSMQTVSHIAREIGVDRNVA